MSAYELIRQLANDRNVCHAIDVDQAVSVFGQLQQVDPYRLDNMDTYSNLLYVKVCNLPVLPSSSMS